MHLIYNRIYFYNAAFLAIIIIIKIPIPKLFQDSKIVYFIYS